MFQRRLAMLAKNFVELCMVTFSPSSPPTSSIGINRLRLANIFFSREKLFFLSCRQQHEQKMVNGEQHVNGMSNGHHHSDKHKSSSHKSSSKDKHRDKERSKDHKSSTSKSSHR
jgi:hypothetical protein